MKALNGQRIFAAMSGIDEALLADALPPSWVGGRAPRIRMGQSASRHRRRREIDWMNSGWVAAVLSVIVGLGLIIGLVALGRSEPPVGPGIPAGSNAESKTTSIESTTPASSVTLTYRKDEAVLNDFFTGNRTDNQTWEEYFKDHSAVRNAIYVCTPEGFYEATGAHLFGNKVQGSSYARVNGQNYPLHGSLIYATPCDYDLDGTADILYTYAWGSGVHVTGVALFNVRTGENHLLTTAGLSTTGAGYTMDDCVALTVDGGIQLYEAEFSAVETEPTDEREPTITETWTLVRLACSYRLNAGDLPTLVLADGTEFRPGEDLPTEFADPYPEATEKPYTIKVEIGPGRYDPEHIYLRIEYTGTEKGALINPNLTGIKIHKISGKANSIDPSISKEEYALEPPPTAPDEYCVMTDSRSIVNLEHMKPGVYRIYSMNGKGEYIDYCDVTWEGNWLTNANYTLTTAKSVYPVGTTGILAVATAKEPGVTLALWQSFRIECLSDPDYQVNAYITEEGVLFTEPIPADVYHSWSKPVLTDPLPAGEYRLYLKVVGSTEWTYCDFTVAGEADETKPDTDSDETEVYFPETEPPAPETEPPYDP